MEVIGTPDGFQRARKLRREMTKPERLLWSALKADKTGFHFRRQHAAGPYVLDFYCDGARLCVEVDGSSHELTTAHDQARDRYFARWGILTLRVPAQEVITNLQGVVDLITQTASARPMRQPSRSPLGELSAQLTEGCCTPPALRATSPKGEEQ